MGRAFALGNIWQSLLAFVAERSALAPVSIGENTGGVVSAHAHHATKFEKKNGVCRLR